MQMTEVKKEGEAPIGNFALEIVQPVRLAGQFLVDYRFKLLERLGAG